MPHQKLNSEESNFSSEQCGKMYVILSEIYSGLKDKSQNQLHAGLNLYEQIWMESIEKLFEEIKKNNT